jgi:hypothetical protein
VWCVCVCGVCVVCVYHSKTSKFNILLMADVNNIISGVHHQRAPYTASTLI